MRALGIDLGARRIGLAISDEGGILASPHAVLQRSGDESADHRAIATAVEELGAKVVVVGLPLSLDGSRGEAAQRAEQESARLAAALEIPVELFDERLTTVIADKAGRGRKGARERRATIDSEAAAVILQSWLDSREA